MSTVVEEVSRAIDPERLLIVRLRDEDEGEREVVAISCRYVPAIDVTGKRAVAVEILLDPTNERPGAPYYCPPQRLRRELLDPRRILSIRPYAA